MNLGNTCFMTPFYRFVLVCTIIYVMFKVQTENLKAILQFKAIPIPLVVSLMAVSPLCKIFAREVLDSLPHTLHYESFLSQTSNNEDLIYLKDAWLFFSFFRASHSCLPLQHGYKIFLMKEMEIL